MLAVDANFRAKNLIRSSEAKDPGLHTGLAYFVENEGYKAHVMKSATQTDVSPVLACISVETRRLMVPVDQHMQRVSDPRACRNEEHRWSALYWNCDVYLFPSRVCTAQRRGGSAKGGKVCLGLPSCFKSI